MERVGGGRKSRERSFCLFKSQLITPQVGEPRPGPPGTIQGHAISSKLSLFFPWRHKKSVNEFTALGSPASWFASGSPDKNSPPPPSPTSPRKKKNRELLRESTALYQIAWAFPRRHCWLLPGDEGSSGVTRETRAWVFGFRSATIKTAEWNGHPQDLLSHLSGYFSPQASIQEQ